MGIEGPFNDIPPQKLEESSKQPQEIDDIKSSNLDHVHGSVPKDIDSLTTKLKDYFYDQSDPLLQKDKETYLENVHNNEELSELIAKYPSEFYHLFCIKTTQTFLSLKE